jgi:hypothetical protein
VRAAGGTIVGADGSTVSDRIVRPDGESWGRSGCGRGADDCAALMHRIVRKTGVTQSVGVLGATGGAAPGAPALPAAAGGAGGTSGSTTPGDPCACACACQAAGTDTSPGARPAFTPALQASLRPSLQIDTRVPAEPRIYPTRGTRRTLVHIAGMGLSEATAVYFGDTPASIITTQGDRLSVLVPDVPSEAMSVSLQMPAGRVTLRDSFQVYQLPYATPSLRVVPCSMPRGEMAATITALAPLRAMPGEVITITASGVGAVKAGLDAAEARRSAFSAHAGLLGVAFTFAPRSEPRTGIAAVMEAASGHEPEQAPIAVAEVLSPDTVRIRVPQRAVSGPLALVAYESVLFGGYNVNACSAGGPDLQVAPPAPRR